MRCDDCYSFYISGFVLLKMLPLYFLHLLLVLSQLVCCKSYIFGQVCYISYFSDLVCYKSYIFGLVCYIFGLLHFWFGLLQMLHFWSSLLHFWFVTFLVWFVTNVAIGRLPHPRSPLIPRCPIVYLPDSAKRRSI